MKKMHLRVIAVIFLGIILVLAAFLYVRASKFVETTGLSLGTVGSLLFDGGATLSSTEGRTNILILGVGGGDHEGPDLTDTILIVSLSQESKDVAMISLPRDIWSDTLQDKINSAYHYGEEKREGGGLILSKAIIEEVVGLPLHYGFIIDFSGFVELIDQIGGIDVDVSTAFIDTEYPIAGRENDLCGGDRLLRCRYETVAFAKGVEHMNGARALAYVRSRHAEGDEGSDFARGKRQQAVLLAAKERLSATDVWLPPSHAQKLLSVLDQATMTDLNVGELATIGKFFLGVNAAGMKRISIEEYLYEPPVSLYGRYVLLPSESFEYIHAEVKTLLER